jgi:hypothetical protein
LAWQVCAQLLSSLSWGHGSYQMTEWLINYSGGFVRRGLPGTLIGMVSSTTGIQANIIVISTSLVCYFALGAWLLRRATSTFPAAFVLSCVVMGIPAYQDSIVRKDCLGLLLLLGCLAVERRRMPRALTITAVNLLAVVSILCHEAFVFYALAGFAFFRCGDQEPRSVRMILGRCLSLLPAGICFLLTAIYHGTPELAAAVNDSWLSLWRVIDPGNPALGTPAAAIEALGWTSEKGLSLSIHMLTSGFYQPLAWAMVFAVSFALAILFSGQNFDCNASVPADLKARVAALLLAQLIFISPLFLLGVDYGRWLFLWVVSSMILHTMDRRAPIWLEALVARVFRIARVPALLARMPVRNWYLLFFGVPVCWNFFNFLTASPVSRHLHFIWTSMR